MTTNGESEAERENSETRVLLEEHYLEANRRLEEQGFSPERDTERHLVFDDAAFVGYQQLIRDSLAELLRHGIVAEEAIILVGERVFLDGELYSLVHGVLESEYTQRGLARVNTPYKKIIEQIQSSQVRDVNGHLLAEYEMVGILHTHPLQADAVGNLVEGAQLSGGDKQSLKALDSIAPGFIAGSITPGASDSSGQIKQEIGFWNRLIGAAQPIASTRVM